MRTKIVIPVADTHAGSSTGLCPPNWNLENGGTHRHSATQKILWDLWLHCWNEVYNIKKKLKADLVIAHNGDAVDGVHHGTNQIITSSRPEQARIHLALMHRALDMVKFSKNDRLFYIYGTETHVSHGEDQIARDYKDKRGNHMVTPMIAPTVANDYQDGRFVFDHLKLDVNGVLFDIAHHPPVGAGTRIHTRGNSLRSLLRSVYYDKLERGLDIPRYWVCSHYHQFVSEELEQRRATIRGLITPAFQGKTHYGHRVANTQLSDMGMVWFVCYPDGTSEMQKELITVDESESIVI